MVHSRLKEFITNPENHSGHIRSPAPFIYTVPVYSPRFCRDLIKLAEWCGVSETGLVDLTAECPRTYKVLFRHAEEYLLPLVKFIYPGMEFHKMENPVVEKHTRSDQPTEPGFMPGVDVQIRINLNDKFKGGGLDFREANYSSQGLPLGYGVIFPGKITHPYSVLPVVESTWYDLHILFNSLKPEVSDGI